MEEEARQTVAGAYAKINAHEDLCAERYRGIHGAIAELKGFLRWISTGIVAVLVSLLGWALFQLYTLEPLRQTQTSSVTVSTSTATPVGGRRGP